MARARSGRGRNIKCSGGGNPALQIGKPFVFGLVAALVVSMAFVMLFALLFVVMKSIVSSAVIPLSVVSLMLGCFAGGWICGSVSRQRGLFYGLAIGLTVFLGAWIIGIAMDEAAFSFAVIVKLILLLLAGGCGGWLGSNRVRRKRR
ncbi:MAG: TIGR04086 family membrane protein [Clostridia bacterium]|nr:TIGR04086 family membrane protein [Clostridia bacterium]